MGNKKTNNRREQKYLLPLVFVLCFVVVLRPTPAKADIFDAAILAAIHAEQLIFDLLNKLQAAAHAATDNAGKMLQAKNATDNAQALSNEINQTPLMNAAGTTVGEYQQISTTNYCRTSTTISAIGRASQGTAAASHAVERGSVNSHARGTDPSVASASLIDECKKGFRDSDSSGPYGDLLQKAGCQTPPKVNGKDYLYADTMIGSVIDPDQYSVPAKAAVKADGSMSLPDATDLSSDPKTAEAEENYIAAYYYCERWKPHMPHLASGKGRSPSINDIMKIESDLDLTAKSDGPYRVCLDAVARRTAVSTAAKGISAGFGDMYNNQVQACLQMNKLGVLSDADYQDCQKNGMSQIALERKVAYRYGNSNFMLNMSGTRQMTPAKVSEMQETVGYSSIFEFENKLEMEKIGVATALSGELSVPPGSESNPAARPTQ